MYEEYRAGLAAVAPEARGAFVAGWLRRSDDPPVLQHACAMAQTLFRAGDLDGYLEIVGGFLEAHPRALEPSSKRSWLSILGRYPYHGRRVADATMATRYVTWLRDRLLAENHPALFETLREFLLAITGSGEIISECLRILEDARYPEECRERVREIHREALLGALPRDGAPLLQESLAKRGLLWNPDRVELQRALVSALVQQARFEDAVALGTGWLRAHEPDLELLRSSIRALDGAGHAPEAIAVFHQYGPGVTGDPDFSALLVEVLQLYRRVGRDREAIAELEPFFEPSRRYEATLAIAALHARHNANDRALHFIRAAIAQGGPAIFYNRAAFLAGDFEGLRGIPEFEALLLPPPVRNPEYEDDESDE